MKKSTERRFSSTVSTEKKSQASIDEAWERRNSAQVGPLRIGDGSMSFRCKMAQTLEGDRHRSISAGSGPGASGAGSPVARRTFFDAGGRAVVPARRAEHDPKVAKPVGRSW